MDASKTQIVRDIAVARTYLEKALDEVLNLPVRAGTAANLAAHTLGSYIVLARGTVDLLREELREYPVRDVYVWLDGLARTVLLTALLSALAVSCSLKTSAEPPQKIRNHHPWGESPS